MSGFLSSINKYYEKLFSIPEKLLNDKNQFFLENREYENSQLKQFLNEKLIIYLERIESKFHRIYENDA